MCIFNLYNKNILEPVDVIVVVVVEDVVVDVPGSESFFKTFFDVTVTLTNKLMFAGTVELT
jgi:hypothetical protein